MNKLLIVVDMQNDFVTGSLGSKHALAIVDAVKQKVVQYKQQGNEVIFTLDTHFEDYLCTQEGRRLPVVHCVKNTSGHDIIDCLNTEGCKKYQKLSFGCLQLAQDVAKQHQIKQYSQIELCGLCTDICVVSNALILKAQLPEVTIMVDSTACAGTTQDNHNAALQTMRMCQIEVI